MTPWPTILRRFALWTIVCAISATPSFWLARGITDVDVAGMMAGVALFVVLYTLATSTHRFERIYRRPFVRATMYIGYGLRLSLSTLVMLAVFGPPATVMVTPDLFAGVLSVNLANRIGLGIDISMRNGATPASPFLSAFVVTCIQGALLNVIVFIVMAIAYVAQRLFRKPPPEDDRHRGFEVLPLA